LLSFGLLLDALLALLLVLLLLLLSPLLFLEDLWRPGLSTLPCELADLILTRSDRSVMVRIASNPDPCERDINDS
jgi:hypothetical protein